LVVWEASGRNFPAGKIFIKNVCFVACHYIVAHQFDNNCHVIFLHAKDFQIARISKTSKK